MKTEQDIRIKLQEAEIYLENLNKKIHTDINYIWIEKTEHTIKLLKWVLE